MSLSRPAARLFVQAAVTLLAACCTLPPALAITDPVAPLYGALSNFDVYNDNPPEVEVHGFEIELHGVHKSHVSYSFGAPYQAHYGDPIIEDRGLDSAGQPVTRVRYESPKDTTTGRYSNTTQHASAVTDTSGHSCYLNGPIQNYETSGCEHFGVGIVGTPTRTVYRWLMTDPSNPNALVPVTAGGVPLTVKIPAPVWNVQPPAIDALNPEPVVQAEVEAPELEHPSDKFGPALWMKVTKTETEAPADLIHLLSDDAKNPINDDRNVIETEIEWDVIQKRNPLFVGGGGNGGGGNRGGGNGGRGNCGGAGAVVQNQVCGGQLQEGKKSVTRRYEFYAYAGTLTDEGEADPQLDIDVDAAGAPLQSAIGALKGAQMVAMNLDSDGDGVNDGEDNCILVPNKKAGQAQRDDDGDGIGNACDAHWWDNNAAQNVDLRDLVIFKQAFGKAGNLKEDLNEDGRVNLVDLAKFKAMFRKPSGKSGKKICSGDNQAACILAPQPN